MAVGLNSDGRPEVLGPKVGASADSFWINFPSNLSDGPPRVHPIFTDALAGTGKECGRNAVDADTESLRAVAL